MSGYNREPTPQELTQTQPTAKRSTSARAGSVGSLLVTALFYFLFKTFAPENFFLELLISTVLVFSGAAAGYWLAKKRLRNTPPRYLTFALLIGQAVGFLGAMLLTGKWLGAGFGDLVVSVGLAAWVFFHSRAAALYSALIYQVLSASTRVLAMFGPAHVAPQLPWLVSHILAVWALILAIRSTRRRSEPPVPEGPVPPSPSPEATTHA